MKRKLTFWVLSLGAALSLALPWNARATGACTAARFHFWQDFGCNQIFDGVGGFLGGKTGAGGNQSSCASGGCGMPRWWVSEPYEDLWMSDTPLSYTMSSGQPMKFTFYYRQAYKLPDADEVPDYYSTPFQATPRYDPGWNYYAQWSYYGDPSLDPRNTGMTNAAWGNNWMMDIEFWDVQWEADYITFGHPPGRKVYSDGYEALVFRPEGGIQYFYSTNNNTQISLKDPRSQVQLTPLSALGYPTVVIPTPDTNGIYWGDPQTNGFRLIYPDGSQEVFGLCYNVNPLNPVNTTAHAFLTERIDPAGRITRVGYEQVTNSYAFRIKYVVDPDGRTNTFKYATTGIFYHYTPNPWQLVEVDDPYGRKTQLGYDFVSGALTSITDAAGMTSHFQYNGPLVTNQYIIISNIFYYYPTNIVGYCPTNNPGWITNLTTPYGSTAFSYYDVTDTNVLDGFQQRAVFVREPEGAQQLFYYLHDNTKVPSTDMAPAVPGQTFDDGTAGGVSGHNALTYRNTYHWGARQMENMSTGWQYFISQGDLADALLNLTTNDYDRAEMRHWLLLGADEVSITEALSNERDPSPDAAGQTFGLRTWYNYPGKPSAELLGDNPQVQCVARTLPDGTSQYVTYNFYQSGPAAGLVSDNESTYSKPDGSIGVLTNWFGYDADGIDLIGVTNSAGQTWSFGYNGHHQVTSVLNPLRQQTTLTYNPINTNLSSVQWPSGLTATLTYNSDGYWQYTTPPTNRVWISSPDFNRLQAVSWSPSGRSFTVNAWTNGLPWIVTDDRGMTVTNSWDGLNRLTGTTFPDGTSISNVYDRLDLGATKDRLGNWTLYGHDGLQHLTVITNADHAPTFLTWCGCGSLESIMDAGNNPTTFSYDNQGNLTNVIFPDNTSITYQYDLAGRMTNAYDGSNPPKFLHFGYNNQGLVTSVANTNGTLQSVIYDAVNRPVLVTDANGITVTNTYDAINELLARKWTDGIGEGFGYSAAGLIAYTNRDGQFTHYGLDAAGRVTSVTNANQEVIQLGYDSLDNVTSLIDGLTHQTMWQYNEYGWLTNKTDGLSRNAFRFAYNANGWVTNRWTPEKGNTGYTYDNVGNLKTITYPQSSIAYAYDALNRLTNVVSANFTNSFAYTPAGQLAVEAGPWPDDAVSNSYSQMLRMSLNLLQPSGAWTQTSYGYDSVWRLQSLSSPAGNFSYTFNGAVSPLVKTLSLPNNGWITNHYDSLARLDYTGLANSSGHVLDGYAYALDAMGLRTNVTRDFGLMRSSAAAGYDNIGQITSWIGRETNGTARLNEQLGWGYDAADNLHYRTNNALVQTFTVDAANELTGVSRSGTLTVSGNTPAPAASVTVNGQAAQTYADFTFASAGHYLADGANSFTNVAVNPYGLRTTSTLTVNLPASQALLYDANGNLTNDGTRSFAYDSENELTNVMVAGQWETAFVYDGLGRRRIARDYRWDAGTSGWMETNEVRYIYDGMLPVQERDSNNVVQVTYTRGTDLSGSIAGAGGIGGLLARTDGNGSTFYHADGAGNITALMDGSQYMVGRYLYDPFGKLIGKWGSMADANVMRFSSMPQHDGLSLYTFRAYDPNLQRWLNEDPIQEWGGINLYRIAQNSPLNYGDPDGQALLSFIFGYGWSGDAADAFEASVGESAISQWNQMAAGMHVFRQEGVLGSRRLLIDQMSDRYANMMLNYGTGNTYLIAANDVTGGTALMQALYGIDLQSQCELNKMDRWQQGLFGVGQIALTTAGGLKTVNSVRATGGLRSMMSAEEAARYDAYWASLGERAPVQSTPYSIIPKYDANGGLRGAMTYDKYGNRIYQYEFGPTIRHGEGYHFYDNSATGSFGNGSRSGHIPY